MFSCDDFEKTISEKYPDVFNSNSKDGDETPFESRDSRSDDQVSSALLSGRLLSVWIQIKVLTFLNFCDSTFQKNGTQYFFFKIQTPRGTKSYLYLDLSGKINSSAKGNLNPMHVCHLRQENKILLSQWLKVFMLP